MQYLKDDDWWLEPSRAQRVLRKLGKSIPDYDKDYIRRIRIWLPELEASVKPPCPVCKTAANVRGHGVASHCARRISGLYEDWWVMSKRYLCGHCLYERKQQKQAAMDLCEQVGMDAVDREEEEEEAEEEEEEEE